MTFKEIWNEFLEQKRRRVKPSTVSTYRCLWESIKEEFGEREIESITTKSVEKWAITLLDTLNKKTIKDRIMLLNNIIDYYGYEYEVCVNRVNMKYIHWPSNNIRGGELEPVKAYTPQEIRLMLEEIARNPLPSNILVAIMIGTGIRIGEACALTYGDVNLQNGTIEIKRTLERITIDASDTMDYFKKMNVEVIRLAKKSALILSSPKCYSSYRSIPIPSELLKILKSYKTIFPPAYYIGSNMFKPTEPRVFRLHYYELLKNAGIEKRFNPHVLRHTYATTLMTSGVDVKTTAALLGHGDASTTLDIYSHATTESKKKAMTNTIGKQFKIALSLGKEVKE